MATMSNFIGKLENYGDLEVSIIRSTKINKVLKALIKLNTIPKDEEFNFKSRSVDLLGRWNKALGADSTADDTAVIRANAIGMITQEVSEAARSASALTSSADFSASSAIAPEAASSSTILSTTISFASAAVSGMVAMP